ncbi:FAD-binding oxidoreductase [Paludibacterium yongneupense]|uniref:FAD-binding oxidoreductase n=1 Tax=Paludibacterium yongneupense TaxID=400061 RepID=UPI0004281305|nr:FAD-binding oxidoreductase [Paludibacterium yongneupense]
MTGNHGADVISALPLWRAEEDDMLECVQIRAEARDVKTFVFRAQPARRFAYLPGQFLTLELPVAGETVRRCYTLSSSPTRPDRVAITVKRVPGGLVSNLLHDTLRPGMRLRVIGPAGDFSCAGRPDAGRLFLSAGSGITPLMSMCRWLGDLGGPFDLVFVHSARSPLDLIFRDELAGLAREHPGLRLQYLCESRDGDAGWSGVLGRLDAGLLTRLVPDAGQRQIYCCGPAPYMAAVRAALADLGCDPDSYHEESFDFTASPAPAAGPVAASAVGAGYKLDFTVSGKNAVAAPGQTVLSAAAECGMRIPSSCSRGVCGTCKSRLAQGRVDMKHGGGIRQREIDQGFFLPCCSTPLSDLVIER